MSWLQTMFAAAAAIILFLYGLQGFSHEVRTTGGEPLQRWLTRVTANRFSGFSIGAVATAVVQSSTAVSSLVVALVDAGTITLKGGLAVIAGAIVGTTGTAWLVSFKLTGIGPIFIVLGALLSTLPLKVRVIGKAIFYFGLIFVALDLISAELRPLQDEPFFHQWLGLASTPWIGILSGIAATALLQSSTVTAGLAIILVQQGALPPQAAIPIVIGATIGTTSTALVASLTMTPAARATAFANLTLCAITALLYFPFLQPFAEWITSFAHDAAQAVAWAQTIFNLSVALLCLAILDYIGPRFERWMSLSRPA